MKPISETIEQLDRLQERYLTKEQDSGLAADPSSDSSIEGQDEEKEEATEVDIALDIIENSLVSCMQLLKMMKMPQHLPAVAAALGDDFSVDDVMGMIVTVLQSIGADSENEEGEEDGEEEPVEAPAEEEPKEEEPSEEEPEEPAASGEGEEEPAEKEPSEA